MDREPQVLLRGIDYAILVLGVALTTMPLVPWFSAHAPASDIGFASVRVGGGPWSNAFVVVGGLIAVAVLMATVIGRPLDYVGTLLLSIIAFGVAIGLTIARSDLASTVMKSIMTNHGQSGNPNVSPSAGPLLSFALSAIIGCLAVRGLVEQRRGQALLGGPADLAASPPLPRPGW